jgi:hypothetical protein
MTRAVVIAMATAVRTTPGPEGRQRTGRAAAQLAGDVDAQALEEVAEAAVEGAGLVAVLRDHRALDAAAGPEDALDVAHGCGQVVGVVGGGWWCCWYLGVYWISWFEGGS